MKKIYLAGPDVFAPNNIQIGENNKKICEENGFIGFYPLDIEIKRTSLDVKYDIVKADILAIEQSDYVVANLSNFRGTMLHPSCDSGTAWECGYGLSKGKRVLGYTTNLRSIPDIMLNQLDLIAIGDLNDIIQSIRDNADETYDFVIDENIDFKDIKLSNLPIISWSAVSNCLTSGGTNSFTKASVNSWYYL